MSYTQCDCTFLFSGNRKYNAPKHGMKSTKMYTTYKNMKARCFSSTKPGSIKYYQAKNIGMCEQWVDSFLAFYSDMGDKPSPTHSIDRKDGSKGYCPHNCHWATPKQQTDNRVVIKKSKPDYVYIKLSVGGKSFNIGKFESKDADTAVLSARFQILSSYIA